ncbi:hypothetical protein J4G07_10830 [Candidatus Poribacteria bacterium]|nr:hypothetical protein [Candidatus Poribacteria bacterium]
MSRRLGRAERKKKTRGCQIRLKSDLSAYPRNTAAKPNFIPPEVWALHKENVGFHSVFGQCGVSGNNFVFL